MVKRVKFRGDADEATTQADRQKTVHVYDSREIKSDREMRNGVCVGSVTSDKHRGKDRS